MVSDPILRIVVCSYFLTAVKSRHLRFPFRALLIHRFLVFNLENFLFQNLCSPLFVGVLTAFFLNENSYSCGNMNGSASWLNFVNALSSRATWSGELIFYFLWIHFKSERNNWHNNHRYCTGVKSTFSFGLWNSNDFVDSWFTFHHFMAVVTLNSEIQQFISFANSYFLGWIWDTDPPTLHGGKCFIHLTEVLNKDAAFWPSSSWPKLEDDIVSFVVGSRWY